MEDKIFTSLLISTSLTIASRFDVSIIKFELLIKSSGWIFCIAFIYKLLMFISLIKLTILKKPFASAVTVSILASKFEGV